MAFKPNFLLSVRALSKTFRRLFLDGRAAAFVAANSAFSASSRRSQTPPLSPSASARSATAPFVVYAKPPFGGPECVLA